MARVMQLPFLKMFLHGIAVVVVAMVMTVIARHEADLFTSTETNTQKSKNNCYTQKLLL